MKTFLRTLFFCVLFIVFCSHELFLRGDSHFLVANSNAEIYLFNGTFDKSENAITRDRIVDPKIIGPDYNFVPKNDNYYDINNITYLKFKTGKAGTYSAGISTLPKVLAMSAPEFTEYLEHEGLESTLEERKREGINDKGVREKYSKHVKALLQVDDELTEHYAKEFGYPIEFIPLENPFDSKVGEDISFRLLRDGKPLPNQTVHYSTSVPGMDAHENENSTKTDKDGVCSITPGSSGKWYVATIHMTKSYEKEIDYESNWATLTFEIK